VNITIFLRYRIEDGNILVSVGRQAKRCLKLIDTEVEMVD
jgi:hypothetical protein